MESKLTRRNFNGLALSAAITHSLIPFGLRGFSRSDGNKDEHKTVHPGMLHNKDDLARMRDAVRAHHEPIISGFEVFRQHPNSQSTYAPRGPAVMIGRNPTVHVDLFDSDSNAAYQCALMWCITGDHAYAKSSIRILNEWASTLKEITGADAVLCASLGGFKLVNAAELIRHTGAGWGAAEVQLAINFFRRVLFPVLHNFAPFANGNWDTAAIKCMMAIGIFCDDVDLVDDALRYYLHGCGDGRLENYVYPGGQCQESGRDQQHTQLGLAHMGDACEMAWNQGLDLYGVVANRVLEGFEYAARYNLGSDVAFSPDHDRTGKYTHHMISPRGSLRPVYEQIYNHYVHRKKMTASYTQRAAEKLRPEGAANGADHTGFGTLLYSRTANDPALSSDRVNLGSLHAAGSATEIRLAWVPSYLAKTYTISRSEAKNGSYRTIAADVAEPTFTDRNVIANQSYFYRVAPTGVEHAPRHIGITAGLPRNWSEHSYGEAFPAGSTDVAADVFQVQAYGTHPFGHSDELHFVHSTLTREGVLTARLSPLLASQAAAVGLMLRADNTDNAPMAAFSVSASTRGERPQWIVSLLSRENAGEAVRTVNALPLVAPLVTWGRIAGPIWLRLSRDHGKLRALLSEDGLTWMNAGETSVTKRQLLAGCFACSGLGSISAQVTFEQVTLKGLQ
jgi:hypothetical protein